MADTAARLAISARRNEVARFTIAVTGIDMTGVAMAMQIRLGRDVPGAPLIALATVSTLAAEGLKLDSVSATNGVPTSIIKGRINASTMTDATKVPYAGEMGDNTTLAYAMQWTLNGDAQTRLYGDFIVLGSAFGSDNAPTNRPQSYGVSSTSGGSSGGSLTFGDQVIRVSIDGIDQIAPLLATAVDAASDAGDARDEAVASAESAAASAASVFALRQKADLYIVFGQSLTVGRSPQMTSANGIVASLFTLNGGSEAENVTSPSPLNSDTIPVDPANMAQMVGFVPSAGRETWAPGLGYQSAKAGVPRGFVWVPGRGSMSLKLLHAAHMQNLRHGVARAVKMLRQAGYEPTIRYIFVHGHADADTLDDGNNAGGPTSKADYTLGMRKLFAGMRLAATQALGYTFTEPIWLTPVLTQNGVASYAARRDVVMAQVEAPTTIPGVRLLPPHSQFANLFDTDLIHPTGAAYRYYAELAAAYILSGLTPPMMRSKAVSGGQVVVTFDQPLKLMATADATSPGNSRNGFTVIDSAGAEVAVTAAAIAGSTVTLTVASTANLTGAWFVRNGLQQMNTLGQVSFPAQVMPRTCAAGLIDAGTAQDGTPLQNLSVPQEL